MGNPTENNRISKEEILDNWEITEQGSMKWKKHRFSNLVGREVGCLDSRGYRIFKYKNRQYKVHRVIYAFFTGDWPDSIDHINRDPADNRLINLRPIDHIHNLQNVTKTRGVSRYRGVSYQKGVRKPRAFVQYKNKREFLGYFESEEAASFAYESRRKELSEFSPTEGDEL